MNAYSIIQDDLYNAQGLATRLARSYRRPSISPEDVCQEATIRLLTAMDRHPDLVARLQTDARLRRAYVVSALRTSAATLFRQENRSPYRAWSGQDCYSMESSESPDGVCIEDAMTIIRRVKEELPPLGRLALAVTIGTKTLEAYACAAQVSKRTASRRFMQGIHLLREICQRVLRSEYGEEAAAAFCAAVTVFRRAYSYDGASLDILQTAHRAKPS